MASTSSLTSSNIGLGSLTTTSTGGTSMSGTLFGVDINTLVGNLVDAKGVTNTKRQVQIDANTTKLSAYATLQTHLTALKDAATALRNPRVTSGAANAFNAKQSLSRESGSITAANLFGLTVDNGTANGSYSLTINRIATADSITGTVAHTSATTTNPITTGGDLVINGKTISLTAGMTLNNIRDAINNSSADSKVKASIIQSGATAFKLVLKGSETGKAITLSDSTSGTILSDLGIAASGATDTSLSAEVILDGVTAVRANNSISDLITGASFQLYQADIGKPVSITIDNNLTGISDAVTKFIDAYNTMVSYVQEQRAVSSDGTIGKDQVLYNDNLMLSTYRSIQSAVSGGVSGVASGNLANLGDIGIDLGTDGKLSVTDNTVFEDALLKKFDQVTALFGFSDTSSSGVTVVDRPDAIPSALAGKTVKVKVTATDTSSVPTAAEFEVDGAKVEATIQNGFIKGATGTSLEGFSIGYTGGALTSPATFEGTFKPAQGVADQIAGMLTPLLDATTGQFAEIKTSITDKSTRLTDQITTFKAQLELFRDRLLLQFQAAQTAISALESQKSSIQSYVASITSGN